jgi:hypothetical protein
MAVVESIYSSLILDTKQYEEALRKIVGLSNTSSDTIQKGTKENQKAIDETTKSVDKMGGAMKALAAAASFGAIVAGFKGMIDSAVQAESQIKGLAAVIKNKLGAEAVPEAAKMVKTLSTELGLTTGAVTQATKNLVSMGFSLADTEKLLRGATDMAVDNRQAHYDLSESVQVWTEGLKNNNSTLSDAIGISENISKQYSRLGVDADKLGDAFAGVADRTKLVNDFTSQFAVNAGRAKENLQGYSGATQSLDKSTSELSISVGQILRDAITPFVAALARGLKWIVDWAKNIGTLEKTMIVFAASFATVGSGVLALKGLLAIAAPQMAASLAVATGGVTLLVTALALAVGGIYALMDAEKARKAGETDRTKFQAQAGMATDPKAFTEAENRLKRLGTLTAFTKESFKEFKAEMDKAGVPTEGVFQTRNVRGASGSEQSIVVDKEAMKARLKMFDDIREEAKKKPIIIPVQIGGSGGGGAGGSAVAQLTDSDAWERATGAMMRYEQTAVKINTQLAIFDNKDMTGLQRIAASAKLGAMALNDVAQAATEMGNAMAGQATVKLQNFKQRLDFFANGLNFLAKQQADQRQAEFDAQMEQIAAQNQALLDQERAYQIERAALKAEFDESAKAENERLYQEALEMLRADMEAKKAENDANSADAEQRMINDEALQNDFEQSRIKLRSDFDQKLLDAIKVKDEQLSKNDKAQADKQLAAQTALQAEQVKLQKQKELDDKAADKANEDRTRAKALMEWQAGKAAFQMNKQIQMATIATQMAMTIMMSLAGVAMAFAQGGIPGGIAGMVFAGLITAMSLGAGAMAMGAVASMQYPPPPVFADGGIATQPSIFGEAGAELAIPFNNPGKDFGALKKEVADNLTNGTGGNVTNVYMEGIQINGSNMNPNELADFVAEKIRRDVYMAAAG